MNLSGLVAVSGKPGLFKVIGQSKGGFILQLLEDAGSRIVVGTNARLAALDETTVYGNGEDLALKQILLKMQAQATSHPVPDSRADAKIHRQYFTELVPEHDAERVYASDIKKIISWYKLIEVLPLFTEDDPKDVKTSADTTSAENPAETEETPDENPVVAAAEAEPAVEKKPKAVKKAATPDAEKASDIEKPMGDAKKKKQS